MHAAYNHLLLNPLYSSAILLAVMPSLLLVFARSEKVTQDWRSTGLDSDVELLEDILSGEVVHSMAGSPRGAVDTRFGARGR